MGRLWERFIHWILYPVFDSVNDEIASKISDVRRDVAELSKRQEESAQNIVSILSSLPQNSYVEDVAARTGNEAVNALDKKIDSSMLSVNDRVDRLIFDYYKQKKKIFYLSLPMYYNNIGDQAIAMGTMEFIREYFPDYCLIELTLEETYARYNMIKNLISPGDMIFMHGGGNLGNLYDNDENLRRKVLTDFQDNLVIIMPQTIYFDENGEEEIKKTKEIYERHKKLILFTRGQRSLKFAKENFSNVESIPMIDMAMMLHPNFNSARSGILLCLRPINDESGLTEDECRYVEEYVKTLDPEYDKIDHNHGNITFDSRADVVYGALSEYSKHKVVVTDRLHGIIFSIITRTPCVALRNGYPKNQEYTEMFSDSNAVFFIDNDVSKLPDALEKAMSVRDPVYPSLKEYDFGRMAGLIKTHNLTVRKKVDY